MNKSRKDNKGRALFKGETQRKDGRYAFSYTDSEGKRHHVYNKDLIKLRLKEKEIRRKLDDGLDPAKADRITINQMFDKYISLKYDIKPSTRENYIYMYENYIRDSFGKKKLGKVRYSDVKAFYYSLINERGFQPSSMEICHTLLHPTFTMAVRDGYIHTNPAAGVMGEIKKSHQWEHKKRHALTIEQQSAVSTFLDTHEDFRGWRPMLTVLLGTGMRIGECLGLRWEDIDFKNNEISINHNLVYRKNLEGKCVNHINSPKTAAGVRRIPIIEGVKDALLEELELQRCIGFCRDEIDGYSGFVFSTCEGHV
jgi:integrase